MLSGGKYTCSGLFSLILTQETFWYAHLTLLLFAGPVTAFLFQVQCQKKDKYENHIPGSFRLVLLDHGMYRRFLYILDSILLIHCSLLVAALDCVLRFVALIPSCGVRCSVAITRQVDRLC